ncbi:Maf family protein [Paenibacillus sp. 1001270B_150601_E10]|uniref:Maf family protein n=1 Tax=Paenibacillus sp. 1001270B_150601_E10 TaxID=2787079 RepID=UPI00189FFD9A|nr:Maf family protein [Paenibacillus sp. 1001270B_150601_E10]
MENIQRNAQELPLLVLASSSPRRQELIHRLGLPVEIETSDVEERVEADWTPAQTVEQLARKKAEAVVAERQTRQVQGLVIGADTIVALEEQILGKPTDETDALRMLKMLQGRAHDVYTGIACMDMNSGNVLVRHRRTRVWMRQRTDEQLLSYIATGEPLDKAGAYGIQGRGSTLVERIDGCYFNVVGLSVSLLAEMLESFGIETP